jgi:hypothetical protein
MNYSFANITSLVLLMRCFPSLCVQEPTSIIAGVDTSGRAIIVKWFSEQVIYPQGVYLYRKTTDGEWERLRDKPLKKGDMPVPESALRQDSALRDVVEIAQKATTADMKGLIAALLVTKAVENNHFACFMGMAYRDETVISGISYQYKLTRVSAGKETDVGQSEPVTVGAYLPPDPPKELTVKAKDAETELKWLPEPMRYFAVNVYRTSKTDSLPVKINDRLIQISAQPDKSGKESYPKVFFADKQLHNNLSYTYFLKGVDYFGYESSASESATVAPRDQTSPEPPNEFNLSVDGLKVTLTWRNANPSSDLMGFRIYRSKRLKTGYQAHTSLLATSVFTYTDRVADPGEYFYYVASVDSAGNEGVSYTNMADVADIYPPAAPRGLTAQSDSGQISLQWLANHEKDLKGYQVFRTIEKDNPNYYVLINSKAMTDTSFVDKLPFNARNKFHYKVAAVDSALNRSEYSDPVFGIMPDIQAPVQPFIKEVRKEEHSLVVEWLPNVEPDLKEYNVYRTNLSDTTVQHLNLKPVNAGVNLYTDYLIQPNVPYRYHLTVTDSANNISVPSEYFYAIFAADIAEEKTNPLIDFKVSYKPGQKQVSIKWKLKNTTGLKGVILSRKEDASFVPLTGLMSAKTYVDKYIEDKQQYTYRLHLFFNDGGELRSEDVNVSVRAKK